MSQTMSLSKSGRKRRKVVTVNSPSMKTKMTAMVMRITTRKAATSGAMRDPIGTGTTVRIKRHTSEEIPCLTH